MPRITRMSRMPRIPIMPRMPRINRILRIPMKYDFHLLFCSCIFACMTAMEFIWSSFISIFVEFSEKPVISYIKNENNNTIVEKMPSANNFNICWFGRGPRVQTILAHEIAGVNKSIIKYNREIISTEDGVDISLDWKEHNNEMDEKTPLILCLHGMGGNSKTKIMETFTNLCLKRGYRAVVYNRRGHAGMSLLSRFENVKEEVVFPKHVNMNDMLCVVNHICEKYPKSPKYLFGFSCGANLAITYISKYPDNPFIACVSVSNGYNIYDGAKILAEKSPVCDAIVAQLLKNILSGDRLEEVYKIAKKSNINIDLESVMRCKSFTKMEEMLILPAYGYKSLKEYYDNDSCCNFINNVKTPLLCISNKNDPLVHSSMCNIPYEASLCNENVISIITNHGGHGGWIEEMGKDPWYAIIFFEYVCALL